MGRATAVLSSPTCPRHRARRLEGLAKADCEADPILIRIVLTAVLDSHPHRLLAQGKVRLEAVSQAVCDLSCARLRIGHTRCISPLNACLLPVAALRIRRCAAHAAIVRIHCALARCRRLHTGIAPARPRPLKGHTLAHGHPQECLLHARDRVEGLSNGAYNLSRWGIEHDHLVDCLLEMRLHKLVGIEACLDVLSHLAYGQWARGQVGSGAGQREAA
eukprot:3283045-Prymnesium_polylepis.1